jgi:hypothetical protein
MNTVFAIEKDSIYPYFTLNTKNWTVSCGEDNINKILDYAGNIVVSRPDSALILLDSIKKSD